MQESRTQTDTEPDWTTLGKRLEWVRQERLNLETTRAMSAALPKPNGDESDKYSHATVRRYETDERRPDADYLASVVRLAGVNGHWLLTGEGDPRTAPGYAETKLAVVGRVLDARLTSDEDFDAMVETVRQGLPPARLRRVSGGVPRDPED